MRRFFPRMNLIKLNVILCIVTLEDNEIGIGSFAHVKVEKWLRQRNDAPC